MTKPVHYAKATTSTPPTEAGSPEALCIDPNIPRADSAVMMYWHERAMRAEAAVTKLVEALEHKTALMLAFVLVTVLSPDAPDELPTRTFAEAVTRPFVDFFQRYGSLALGWLALMVLYKLCDAFALSLSTTFLLRVPQFTLTQVGTISKTFGLVAGLLGALAGGWAVTRMRLFPALLILGIAQALVNLSYISLVHSGPNVVAMAGVVSLEYFVSGLGSTAFVVLLTALCNVRFSATQYALLSSLSAVGRVFLGPLAAWLVPQVGWSTFFVITALSALPGLLLVIGLRGAIGRVEQLQAC